MSIQLTSRDDGFDAGTLLWIGDRDQIAFRDAYRFCEGHVSQVAYRADFEDALSRPATDVQTILVCLENDSERRIDGFRSITHSHRSAKAVLLLGPLCAGARPAPSQRFGASSIEWHAWESQLPHFLRCCGGQPISARQPHSIAVVSSSFSNASALLQIATNADAATTWCRPEQSGAISRFDEIWLEDSSPVDQRWLARVNRLRQKTDRVVWVSNVVTPDSKRVAMDAGVDLVIAKPGDYSILIDHVLTPVANRERQAA